MVSQRSEKQEKGKREGAEESKLLQYKLVVSVIHHAECLGTQACPPRTLPFSAYARRSLLATASYHLSL